MRVDGEVVGAIERGLLVYLGIGVGDTELDVAYIADKLVGLRIFADEAGRMSRSVQEVGGGVLVVSQFTLFGDVRSGRRPSFDGAAPPANAERLCDAVVAKIREKQIAVATGRFRAMMEVRAAVDGPVTILIDSKKTF